MLIHDMNTGDRFEGYYILQNIAQRTTAAPLRPRCGITRAPSAQAMWAR